MRKKLLLSRSGFEKPESREEAIMQNILGASNVLEPSESNIEEILKSILYNTPYTKEAEFEIEKILLAIKNNSTYDGEGESRDMKILIAILNDLDYTEEAESRIEELFIEWLQQRQQIKVLEGVPPLTFPSRGLPLINYLIEGNTLQNDTPTPDNPIMPQGTGERTANLTPNQKITSNTYSYTIATHPLINALKNITPNENYTLSWEFSSNGSGGVSNQIRLYTSASGTLIKILQQGVSFTLTSEEIANIGALFCYFGVGNTDGYMDKLMLVEGLTPLPYEPYGYKIPVSSANTTTPVYLGEVQTTRRIKKLVLTGNEDWSGTVKFRIGLSGQIGTIAPICTHYRGVTTASYGDLADGRVTVNGGIGLTLAINDTANQSSLTAWKYYLAQQYANGTPVTVWYVLAEPTTGIVNEPLMKIGSYADSISMEQTGIEIPTINGSNTFDVNTTVKPSNVYIEYK